MQKPYVRLTDDQLLVLLPPVSLDDSELLELDDEEEVLVTPASAESDEDDELDVSEALEELVMTVLLSDGVDAMSDVVGDTSGA